jgi:hypothetical protein
MRISYLKITLLSTIAFLFLTSCSAVHNSANHTFKLSITNPSPIERVDELVVLSREMIERAMGKLNDNYISIATANGQSINLQFDDLNKDGKWDEVAFLHAFKPFETAQLKIYKTALKPALGVVRAHVRMRKKNPDNTFGPLLDSVTVPGNTAPTDFSKQKLPPYLTEGPAWENDKVAFRIYMDTRNTKDIFGKKTAAMMMDTVGVNPENIYHHLSDWGMDILAVGKSLGAGSLALRIPNVNGKDTLVRLGGSNIGKITFEKVADGPIRGILKLYYNDWKAIEGAPPINVSEEISIWGGKFFYQSNVSVTNAPTGTKLVAGIVNLKSKKPTELSIEDSKLLYTYDAQSENSDSLGLALLVKNNNFESFGATPNTGSDILNTYTVTIPLTSEPSQFRFFSCWEKSDLLFENEKSFRKYLEVEAIKYSKNLTIDLR